MNKVSFVDPWRVTLRRVTVKTVDAGLEDGLACALRVSRISRCFGECAGLLAALGELAK